MRSSSVFNFVIPVHLNNIYKNLKWNRIHVFCDGDKIGTHSAIYIMGTPKIVIDLSGY